MNAAMETSLCVFAGFNDETDRKRKAIAKLSEHPEETRDLLNDFEQNIRFSESVFHEQLKGFGLMSRQEAEIAVNLMKGGSIYGR